MELSLHEIISYLNSQIPASYQEGWDNSGLLLDTHDPVRKIMLALDCTEEVVEEAITEQANLIITHHPLLITGIKRMVDSDRTARILKRLIRHNIALFSAHTNLDSLQNGINHYFAETLNLTKVSVLRPLRQQLMKFVVFVPESHVDVVRNAMFEKGCGNIGNYDSCSFNISGRGTFRGNEHSNPFVGERGALHFEQEVRIETIVERRNLRKAIESMIKAHPYEEVAYDVYPLENDMQTVGLGRIGILPKLMDEHELLNYVQKQLQIQHLRFGKITGRSIGKVAVVGGSGSGLIQEAIQQGADAIVTGDLKYHNYVDYGDDIFMIDVGHFESEKISMQIFYDILSKKFPNFAVSISKKGSNPINYR
ncbi:MAG TPA: Nif3-like dinuclear metal center hexameric protein [Salinivirgaceae bacterium]|nr:Nif3-like dinuclear metal center hexameric protein [Salinivirgaceae bacterium]